MTGLAAAAGISISTVKRIESGGPQPVSQAAYGAVRTALETAGVRFLDDTGEGAGLRLRARSGEPSTDRRDKGGEALA